MGTMLPLIGCGDDANSVDIKELMAAGPLPEKSLGKADAPVTVVEYSSLGCPHCAAFDIEVFPHLKSAYIDTGKVRYIARDFPLDQVAAAAAMLARCAPDDKYFDMSDLFFTTQDRWHVSTNSVDALFNLVKQAGFTRESFEACLKDQKLLDGITAVRTKAADKFHVDSTPTFFVNGKKSDTFQSIAGVDKTLSGLLGS
jgi:protein-disulfide isomerase